VTPVEIDEVEFAGGTVPELVEAITARPLPPETDGVETFVTTCPDWWGGGRTFGGMVVAQALHAAHQTVPRGLDVHSLHGYFLRPSISGTPSVHRVTRLRDGRSFTAREVVTEVEGRTAFRMTCSFHQAEPGDEYQLPMADGIPRPEEIAGFDGGPFPFDVRNLGATPPRDDGTYQSTRRCWFRTREPLGDDPALHACVLAYLSDMTGAAFRPLSLGSWGFHADASLDHAVWFHRPRRADVWNLFDLQALVNGGGRSTVRSTMHGEDGTLYLSMAQELLIRELDVPLRAAPPPWLARERLDRERMARERMARDGPA
jgi:acyl-CoA thioesterase II